MARGFTFIEMLVVTAIILILTAVVIAGSQSFNNTILLSNAAYDIALSFRTAQSFGAASNIIPTSPSVGYGLHFDTATPHSYILFSDNYPPASSYAPSPGPGASPCHATLYPTNPDAKPGDCAYEPGAGKDTTDTTYTINSRFAITKFCAFDTIAGTSCTGGANPLTSLDVVYTRSSTLNFISLGTGGATAIYSPHVWKMCLALSSGNGTSRYITVSNVGVIDSNAPSCP